MKKIFTLIGICSMGFSGNHAIAQTGLTNLDFEAVSSATMLGCGNSTNFPTGFRGSNSYTNGACPGHTLTNTPQNGNKYITIGNVNTCGHVDLNPAGFATGPNTPGYGAPFTGRPTDFCGYYRVQGISNTNDSIYVHVYLTKNASVIGRGIFTYGANQANWTNFCANISYSSALNPDTVRIRFTPSKLLSGFNGAFTSQTIIMDIDNCYFNGITGVKENAISKLQWRLWPDPVADKITFETSEPVQDGEFSISNMMGQIVLKKKFEGRMDEINVSDLSPGVYFAELRSENIYRSQKIIISGK